MIYLTPSPHSKESKSHSPEHTCYGFYLYKMSRIGTPVGTESRSVVSRFGKNKDQLVMGVGAPDEGQMF